MRRHYSVTFLLFLCLAEALCAQSWSGILDQTRAIDWSQAGIPGGIPTTRTQCVASQCNTVSGGSVTAATLNAALTAAPSGTFVLIPSGTFTISSTVTIPSNKTLRGAGAQSTILNCGFNDCITMGSTDIAASTTLIGITSGATQGSTSIVVASASGISAGGYLIVSELNNGSAPYYATNVGGEGTCSWCDQWSGTRARGQIVEVTSVNGTTIGITPLYSAYTQTPAVTPFTMAAKYAGLENLQLYMTKSSYDGSMTANIYMGLCAYCWIKGVEDNYANGDHVQMGSSFRCEVRDSYFSNALNHTSGQTESGIFLIYKASGNLIENNIIERSHDSLVANWGSAGNVFAYNYMFGNFDTDYQTNAGWSINAHGAHPQFNLYEGNVGDMVAMDSIWGSGSHGTLFRNWMLGITARCSPLSNGRNNITCTGPTYSSTQMGGFLVSGLHRSYNFVGNVGGSALAAAHATEIGEQIGGSIGDNWTSVVDYVLGSDPSSTVTLSSSLVFGNYRNAGSSLIWERNVPSGHNPAHPSQTLPASFFRSSKPSWWGTVAWPAIGPDVTGGTGPGGHASTTASNPAQACFNATAKGSNGLALFDADTCYGQGPKPPLNFTAIPQ
jgi:hypothetical protein